MNEAVNFTLGHKPLHRCITVISLLIQPFPHTQIKPEKENFRLRLIQSLCLIRSARRVIPTNDS